MNSNTHDRLTRVANRLEHTAQSLQHRAVLDAHGLAQIVSVLRSESQLLHEILREDER